MIGGQSDNGNNVNGDVVDLTNGAEPPTTVTIDVDLGSIVSMATPFGERL